VFVVRIRTCKWCSASVRGMEVEEVESRLSPGQRQTARPTPNMWHRSIGPNWWKPYIISMKEKRQDNWGFPSHKQAGHWCLSAIAAPAPGSTVLYVHKGKGKLEISGENDRRDISRNDGKYPD
jgi:hypothetical protein